MIEIEELWHAMDERTLPLPAEEIPCAEAVGRVLGRRALSTWDVPAFDHSAVDGWAFAEARPGPCDIVDTIPRNGAEHETLRRGRTMRALTGAPLPEGVHAVAMQENCAVSDGKVRLINEEELPAGLHIRRRGAVFQSGQTVLDEGAIVRPGAMALLVSCGVKTIVARPLPCVTHVVTGAELLAPDDPPQPGKIPDSNGPMIAALLAEIGIRSVTQRHFGDAPEDLFAEVSGFAGDVLLISGGCGPGDHDHTLPALRHAGFAIHSTRVNSRPGKPLIFATRGRQLAFGLPGNPLSHWVCFHAFVRRSLERLAGRAPNDLCKVLCPPTWNGPDVTDGRRTWTPARVRVTAGHAEAEPLPWLHSGDLSPLATANALLLGGPEPGTCLTKALLP